MSPYLGRVIPKALRLNQIISRVPNSLRQLSGAHFTRGFFQRPEVRPVRNVNGLINETQQRHLSSSPPLRVPPLEAIAGALPFTCCPGCGAYAQVVDPDQAGYYSKTRKATWKFFKEAERQLEEAKRESEEPKRELEEAEQESGEEESYLTDTTRQLLDTIQFLIHQEAEAKKAPKPAYGALVDEITATVEPVIEKPRAPMPVCDRCHSLIHHNKAVPVISPSIDSIGAYLEESPYKYNRVYHVIDAADFPMSLVDNIYEALSIQEQRSHNRRASTEKYRRGKKLPTISFVITRSDLLGPTKEKVDSKMEYVRSVLRDALGKSSTDFRLGNVHMISAHRGWWNKKVKKEIKEHGGGIWVVGKANVGKSSFIEACFPKGSENLEKVAELVERRKAESDNDLGADGFLPPAPEEHPYPVLPIVSSLSGTTVSPIRIPFGRGRGEMIDLPGLERGQLADYLRDEHKRDILMTSRVKADRYTIRPGQSLLLGGGLVRITSVNPNDILMAACFIPIEAHLTKTEKAVEMQAEQRPYPGESIVKEGISNAIASAGVFDLQWDVTRSHLPTSIAKAVEDKKMKLPSLPYKVMAADILIEGCGWVELTAQIRAKSLEGESSRSLPQVEIFTPNGQHVGVRRPLEAWDFIAEKLASDKRKRAGRGRQSISQKKRAHHGSRV
ncbi:uncharacterized protein BDW43DRAFT_287362 [Aspergillus alliaceus]|uniref:uncharacterized protein n=1 Tax=Petromyces alliaceus TaxID=209559 RepID=UPI0012A7137F|nr:uncharacterized protein BDW43DRAFT_287362 [Aspergillus alliaceus]KAB8229728.1 hypothetical protein BDW43DRAFT_287362 [Aspergillus alliaceus]